MTFSIKYWFYIYPRSTWPLFCNHIKLHARTVTPLHCTALLHSALDNATITLSQSLSIVMNVVTSTSTFHFYPEYQAAQTLARYWCNLYSCRYYLDILVILPLSGLERWPEATDTEAAGHCPSWWRLGGIMAPIVHQPPAQHQPAEGWGEVRPHQSQHIVTQYILSYRISVAQSSCLKKLSITHVQWAHMTFTFLPDESIWSWV